MATQFQTTMFCLFVFSFSVTANPLVAQTSQSNQELKMSARYHVETGKDTGFLIVKLQIPKGSHIYSLTQKKPLSPSKVSVKNSKQLVAGKTFKPDRKPKVIDNDPIFKMRVEKHSGTVQFFAPIRVDTSADFKMLKPEVLFTGQICSDEGFCKLINNKTVKAEFAGFFEREAKKLPSSIK